VHTLVSNQKMMSADTKTKLQACVRGVSEVLETPRGLTFNRLPKWALNQFSQVENITKVAGQLSGARFEILTSASQVTLRYRSIRDSAPDFNWIAGPSTVAVSCSDFEESVSHSDGDLRIWKGHEVVEVVEGVDSLAVFNLPLSQTPRIVKIWLPQNCMVEVIDLNANADWDVAPDSVQPKWIHYGSSISHCEEASGPLGVWPVAVARNLDLDVFNIGLSGSANLEHAVARTIRNLPADLISLKVGINIVNGANHTERTFGPAVHGFIDTIRDGHPTAPILVISPVCCPGHENNPGPSSDVSGKVVGQEFGPYEWIGELTLRGIRKILAEIVEARAKEDSNIFYLDGLKLFNEVEAESMPDGIHPDAAGYETIAANFLDNYPKDWFKPQ
jgi:hypothetical protein